MGALMSADPQALQQSALSQRSGSILEAISHAARDPQCDVAKMTAMHELFRQVVADEKKDLYDQAMARLQPRLPVIEKNKKGANGKYAPIEEIDARIRPLLDEEGFHFTFTSKPAPAPSKDLIVKARLSHKAGHFEEAELPIALDTSGSKTATQGAVSTASYGIRALKRMMLDLQMVGEDRDGSLTKTISEEQALTIEQLIGDIKDEPKGYRLRCQAKLLGAMAVSTIAQIPAARFGEAVNKLGVAAQGPKG